MLKPSLYSMHQFIPRPLFRHLCLLVCSGALVACQTTSETSRETHAHVAKILALAKFISDSEAYGIELRWIPYCDLDKFYS
ncbi:MAG: hypothetical protein IIC59_10795 [Proteobacteria bacterium]|nr:hypothetical protein [Pseudomonadota bacterium]MCH8175657.1 hypothetical protein [Pseudomonadota bacterium]